MNIHKFIDNLAAKIGGLYSDSFKFFREGVVSPSFTDIINNIELDFTSPTNVGEYQIPVRYRETEGIARYSLLHWSGEECPSLIFHHGSGQTNYTGLLKRLFPKKTVKDLNLIGVSIPFNKTIREYLYGIGSLERFAFLIASSVCITESLGLWLRTKGKTKVTAGGISLGGWVTNMHFAYFGSLDEYRPIFSGAALDELFNNTVYKKLVASGARSDSAEITQVMNFEKQFASGKTEKVFPLMAIYDQYIRFERQKQIYNPENITIIKKGHITGSLDYKLLGDHLKSGLSGS